MATKERKCLSCATKYKYCPSCSRVDALKPAWASQFCSESCATLWTTLTKFGMNRLSKDEAKSVISELDLKPIESYVSFIQEDYAKVMEEEKKSKRGRRIEMPVIDEVMDLPKEVVESIVEELIENKVEQPIEVVEPVEEEPTVHEVVLQENE